VLALQRLCGIEIGAQRGGVDLEARRQRVAARMKPDP